MLEEDIVNSMPVNLADYDTDADAKDLGIREMAPVYEKEPEPDFVPLAPKRSILTQRSLIQSALMGS